MSRLDEIRNLLKRRREYLQVREEQRATYGLDVPPHIILDIENTKEEIERLEAELAELMEIYQSVPPTPPPSPPMTPPPLVRPTSAPQPLFNHIWILIGGGIAVVGLVTILAWYFQSVQNSLVEPISTAAIIPSELPTPVSTRTPTPTPLPVANEPWFGEITFARGYDASKLEAIDPTTCFIEGITEIHAIFEFKGMDNGLPWERVLYRDGEESLRKSLEWSQGEHSIFDYSIGVGGNALEVGQYRLELYINGNLVKVGSFRIGRAC